MPATLGAIDRPSQTVKSPSPEVWRAVAVKVRVKGAYPTTGGVRHRKGVCTFVGRLGLDNNAFHLDGMLPAHPGLFLLFFLSVVVWGWPRQVTWQYAQFTPSPRRRSECTSRRCFFGPHGPALSDHTSMRAVVHVLSPLAQCLCQR